MTCDKCKPQIQTVIFNDAYENAQKLGNGVVELCPLHDGSMEKRLAEALRIQPEPCGCKECQEKYLSAKYAVLAEYEARTK